MTTRLISSVAVTLFLCASVALAHEQDVKGKLTLTITGATGNEFSFEVKGRLTPLFRVTGDGTFKTGDNGSFAGTTKLADHHGDQLFVDFEGLVDRDGKIKGTFTITGGTGHWIGHVGGGTMGGNAGDVSFLVLLDGVMDH